jgi:diguanylate cyclase (GGDEF)-like protein
MPANVSDLTDPTGAREARRLAAVQAHALRGDVIEPGLEALLRLTVRLFEAPMAALALVDAEHCLIEAQLGLPVDPIPRESSVAARIVERAGAGELQPLVIEDALRDPAWASHPLCQGEVPLRFAAGAPVFDAEGEALGALVVFDTRVRPLDAAQLALLRDLALIASDQLQARRRARLAPAADGSDVLTGAAGAKSFFEALEVELRHAMRTGEAFAVLRLDLDGFDDILTAYGPELADVVLREIGRRLRAQVRLGDLLARLGDDDFGVVMRHGGAEDATVLVERITAAVRQPVDLGEGVPPLVPAVSIGMAAYTDQIGSVGELLAQADEGLLLAQGRKASRWQAFGRFFESTLGLRLVDKGR